MRFKIPEALFVDEEVALDKKVLKILDLVPGTPRYPVSGERHPGGGWLLTKNRGQFIKPCPGQKGYVCCGYWVVEWVLGCPFRCEYCALQSYMGSGDLTLYTNTEDLAGEIRELRQRISGPIRLGTGEFGDSLALEPWFPVTAEVVREILLHPGIVLELKTKSDWVEPLRDIEHHDRVVVAFSMNPDVAISRYEHGTATLEQRFQAVEKVLSWGYRVAIHFDPIIPFEDWEDAYGDLISSLSRQIPTERTAWISMGTFRYPEGMDDLLFSRYPDTDLLKAEFIVAPDGKRRYLRPVRETIYRHVYKKLRDTFSGTVIYMCMESPAVWNRVTGNLINSKRLKRWLDEA